MSACTSEQQAILQATGNVALSYIGNLHRLLDIANTRVGALQNLLLAKDFITEEEMQLAIKENEARVAVEMVFNPEIEGFNKRSFDCSVAKRGMGRSE